MHKFYRSVLLTGMVAVGLAGCGDDVTVVDPPAPPPPPAPTVKSISVTPDGTTLAVGGTRTFSAAVVADEGVATTVTWSTSDAAVATINASSGVATGVAAGSVGIKATSTVNPAVQGNATLTVQAAATPTVTGVAVTPPSANLVVGQTVQASANVLGTNNPSQTVTWSSLSPAIASVNTTTGLVTGLTNGTAVIKATSTANTNFSGTMSVTVTTPSPAMVQLQSLTVGTLGTPVVLTNVAGQIEATINIESGAQNLSRVDMLLGGQVIASQSFAVTPAAGDDDASAVATTVVLSFNTNQLRKVNNLFVPVVFNGPNTAVANLFVVGSSTPIASNGIPVVIQNADMMMRPTTLVQVATAGPISNGGNSWYKGNVSVSGGNYVSFFPVTPSITWASTGAVTCGSTGNTVTGTPQTGIALAGTFTCGSSVENAINLGAYTVTPGTAPAADVIFISAGGTFTQAGSAFMLNGENRYNPLAAAAPALANVFIDNKAPVPAVQAGAVSVGPAVAFKDAADQQWVNAAYAFAQDISATDGGSGVLTLEARNYNPGTFVPATAGCSATVVITGNDYTETTTSVVTDGKRICAWASDALGNFANSGPSNYFGVDKVAPSIRFVTATAPAAAGVLATVSSTANTTIYSIAAPATIPANIYAVEANDTRSGFHQGAAITNFPVNMTHTYLSGNSVTTSCAIAGFGLPTVLADTWVRSLEQAIYCAATPQYNNWSAFVADRAGNASTTVARNYAKDDLAVADITNLGFGQLTYAPGSAAAFNIFATDDLEVIEGTLALHYNGDNAGVSEFIVRYPFAMFPLGTRWDNVLTNVVSGAPLTVANLIGRFDTTATATNLPSGGYASRQNALPDTVSANVRDVASQPDATPLFQALNAVTQFSDSTAAPWASADPAVFGNANSIWVISSATAGFEIATQRTGTSVTVPYFDSVNLYGVVGGELVLCGTYGAPVLTDNGVFRTWTYSMSTPAVPNACAGATGWRAGGVKGNAVMLTQQVAP